jgi:hypothetical protein
MGAAIDEALEAYEQKQKNIEKRPKCEEALQRKVSC